jgi:hypothetical protein
MSEKGTRALLLETIKKEVGTVEGPKDNQTKYGAFTKANFLPWCGSFVMWTANQAGVKVPNVVYTPAGVAAFKKMNKWVPVKGNKPQPGWVVFFDFPGGADIDHVGWVYKDNGDGTKQVCDLDTGDCYTVRERDGLIERAGHDITANRRVRVETPNGIKQLLNG